MKTIELKDGRKKHTLPGWVGYQPAGESIIKTKWINLNRPVTQEWKFEASEKSKKHGYKEWIVQLVNNKLVCDCAGYRFRRKCKHSTQVEEEIYDRG